MLKVAFAICLVATPVAAYDLDDYNNGGYLSRPFDSPMPSRGYQFSEPQRSYRLPPSYGSIGKTPPPSYKSCFRDWDGTLLCR